MTELFTFPRQQVDPAYPETRVATVNVNVLKKALEIRASGQAPSILHFNLSDWVSIECQTTAVQWYGDGSVSWSGIVPGLANVSVHLGIVFPDDDDDDVRLSGIAFSLNGDWLIHPHDSPAGVSITPSRVDTLACGNPPVYPQQPTAASEDSSYYAAEDDAIPAVIDVLALYPPATAKAMAHGREDILSYLRQAQELTNIIFSNSDINARVSIIDTQEVSGLEGTTVTALLGELLVPGIKDERFVVTPRSKWDLVSHLRDAAGADIVVLLSDKPGITEAGTVTGTASSIPEPALAEYSDLGVAVFSACLAPPQGSYNFSYTFAHELGHLLGGKHDRITQPFRGGLNPAWDYAHGYVAPDWSFVTVMGYPRPALGINRIPYFSSPDKTWQGQPMGIPQGKPGASDVARLFRLSTRVVSRYRGANSPRWIPVYLNLTVQPSLGGYVTPDQLGPYPQGTQISVRAIARSGYEFDHWVLDGLTTREATQTVVMDKNHNLQAVFVPGTTAQPVIKLGPLALRYGCQLEFMPGPGPSFPAGTNVTMAGIPSYAARQAGVPLVWLFLVEGVLSTAPLANFTREIILEGDFILDLYPSGLRFDVWGQRSLSLNTTSQLVIQATWGKPEEGLSHPPGEPIDIVVSVAPEGTSLTASEAVTDANGLVRVTVVTGNEEGDLALRVKLKDANERSTALIVVAVSANPEKQEEPVAVRVIEHSSQQILEGATPAAIKVLVTHEGKPVAATLDVTVNQPTHGISVTDSHPTTDANGVATVAFAPQSGTPPGLTTLIITDEASETKVKAQIVVLPRKQYIYPLVDLTAYIVPSEEDGQYKPFAFAVTLSTSDAAASHFVTLPSGIKVTFTLNSGTTGIRLDKTEAFYTGTPVYVIATAPTAPGTATFTVSSEYADPIVITINVG